MAIWNIRYYLDPETRLPHVYNHNVVENEVEAVLAGPGEDREGFEGARIAISVRLKKEGIFGSSMCQIQNQAACL